MNITEAFPVARRRIVKALTELTIDLRTIAKDDLVFDGEHDNPGTDT